MKYPKRPNTMAKTRRKSCLPLKQLRSHLNFYRVHVLLFIIVPLLAACVFYVLNDARTATQPFVSFTDSLFLCISAATVAGLFTVPLSNINVGQQIILAFLTAVGSYTFVSAITVVIRRHYFMEEVRKKFEKQEALAKEKLSEGENGVASHDDAHLTESSLGAPPIEERQSSASSGKGFIRLGGGPIAFSDHIATADGPAPYRRRADGTGVPAEGARGVPLHRTTTYKERGTTHQ